MQAFYGWVRAICVEFMRLIRRPGQCSKRKKRPESRGPLWRGTASFASPSAARFRSGAKQGNEQWWIARLNPREERPEIVDIAKVAFASRSLTFDGENFWSNHRAANEIVSFRLPTESRKEGLQI